MALKFAHGVVMCISSHVFPIYFDSFDEFDFHSQTRKGENTDASYYDEATLISHKKRSSTFLVKSVGSQKDY